MEWQLAVNANWNYVIYINSVLFTLIQMDHVVPQPWEKCIMQLLDVRERIGTLTRMIDWLGDKLARDTGRPEEEMEKDRASLREYERRLEEREQERKTLEEQLARLLTSL